MGSTDYKYCLDTNVLIQAWNRYYSPKICPSYWDWLSEQGQNNKIFISEMVFDELSKIQDDLFEWLKNSKIPVLKINEDVTNCLIRINSIPQNKYLVDNTKARSIADPWIIAHAMSENAVVVTKEEKVTAIASTRIKIPNVCESMNVRCINDFEFIIECGLILHTN